VLYYSIFTQYLFTADLIHQDDVSLTTLFRHSVAVKVSEVPGRRPPPRYALRHDKNKNTHRHGLGGRVEVVVQGAPGRNPEGRVKDSNQLVKINTPYSK
jgi:hypothetical protein